MKKNIVLALFLAMFLTMTIPVSRASAGGDTRAALVCEAFGRGETVAETLPCGTRQQYACEDALKDSLQQQYGTTSMHQICGKILGSSQWGFKRIETQRY